ncbi:MAG: 50S ribosomal protein L11 methyltransferase [Christensenellales bacterium]|jgi:ribosomal protein L11 methyltransferase
MDWIELKITTTTAGTEAVSELLCNSGCAGTVIEDKQDLLNHDALADWDYIGDEVYEAYGEDAVVKGYIPKDASMADTIALVRQKLADLKALSGEMPGYDPGELALSLSDLREEDWANEWKKYYKPLRASKRMVIVPSWEDYTPNEGDVVIELDPGMAFGTGTHETTRMCLSMVDEMVKEGDVCIDIGCGTAILGIAAAKLGASDVLAIDRDVVAVESARTNIALNGVADIVRAVEGDLLKGQVPTRKADLIMVNIIADVIIGLLPNLDPFLKQDGVILTSGIIKERERDVLDAMDKAGYRVLKSEHMGEWCAIACARK